MRKGKEKLFWFLTGSQELYGEETLRQVVSNSKVIVEELNKGGALPRKVLFKPVLTTPQQIKKIMEEAVSDSECAGVICWMHTFSPARCGLEGYQF